MKIQKISHSKYTLLRLNLLKSKFFQINQGIFDFESLELEVKRVLQIVYEYHCAGKQILFVDLPLVHVKSFKKTRHLVLSRKILMKGFLSNNSDFFAKTKNRQFGRDSLKAKPRNITKKPDLIVFEYFKRNKFTENSYRFFPYYIWHITAR